MPDHVQWRAAVVGAGYIGSLFNEQVAPHVDRYTHAAAYVHHRNTRLVGMCDSNRRRAVAAARYWSVSGVYTDIAEMLASEAPQILSICTDDESHARHISTALEAPSVRAVLCEKPLALDLCRDAGWSGVLRIAPSFWR